MTRITLPCVSHGFVDEALRFVARRMSLAAIVMLTVSFSFSMGTTDAIAQGLGAVQSLTTGGGASPAKQPGVGDEAAEFELAIVGNPAKTVSLKKSIADGPVVVVVLRGYPGYQCPVCSRQVADIRNRAKQLGQLASKVILVYPGPASGLEAHAKEFKGSQKMPEPMVMVSDPDMSMVSEWGLRWDAPRETAYPSTFVIDKDGKVAWSLISDNHRGRSRVTDIVAALRKL
ncbi:MAG: peroxiredoxin family protein [Planctomycetota bacterium]